MRLSLTAPYALAAVLASLAPSLSLAGEPTPAAPEVVEALRPLAADIGGSRKLEILETPADIPALAFDTLEDGAASLADFKGQVVLLNFWATWCAPCLEEMPALNALQAELGGEDFQVVAVNLDATGTERPLKWLKDNEIGDLPFYRDPTYKTVQSLGAQGMPTTLLVDRAGREIGRLSGAAEWHEGAALEAIKLLIANEAPAG